MHTLYPHPKITPLHLQRKAIVYLRQSSERQGQHHTESQRLQYDLVQPAGITQRVPLVAARRISRAVLFSCTSTESASGDN